MAIGPANGMLEMLRLFYNNNNNNKFNLPSNLVPLMGPRRLIPIVKTQYIH